MRRNKPADRAEQGPHRTFKRIHAAQLRVLLRAIVNLDPYTFADDLAQDIADENEPRSAEDVLLATIDATADDKLTRPHRSRGRLRPTATEEGT